MPKTSQKVGLAVLVAAAVMLGGAAASGQGGPPAIRLEGFPLTGERPAVGDKIAVGGLDCDVPRPPGADVCLVARCQPCNVPIPDLGTGAHDFPITAGTLIDLFATSDCTVRDVNVAVELQHFNVGDLVVDFNSDPGPDVPLYDPLCDAAIVDTRFDDEAAAESENSCPAIGGLRIRPAAPLSAFDGLNAARTYQLAVSDVVALDSGLLTAYGFALALDCVPDPVICNADATTLCFLDNRFEARVTWRRRNGQTGSGQAVPLTGRAGLFYFFNAENLEMLIKMLDACAFNDRFWVFYAATTNVEFELTVTDKRSGEVKRYSNPLGRPAPPELDTGAFDTCP